MRVVMIVVFILGLASATSAAALERIIGGQEASISQFPFMASILISHDHSFFLPACGGAVIGPHTILTTASCLPTWPNQIRARVGSSNATSGGTVLTIDRFVYLSSYNPISKDNDVAVLKNDLNAITFVPGVVMPVGFATLNTIVPDDVQVTIAGWGRFELGLSSEQLRYTQVRKMNNRDCDNYAAYIPFSMFCTTGSGGTPNPDACRGDNGSPVLLNNVVVGLVAQPHCGYYRPSVHTLVSVHSSFIRDFLD